MRRLAFAIGSKASLPSRRTISAWNPHVALPTAAELKSILPKDFTGPVTDFIGHWMPFTALPLSDVGAAPAGSSDGGAAPAGCAAKAVAKPKFRLYNKSTLDEDGIAAHSGAS